MLSSPKALRASFETSSKAGATSSGFSQPHTPAAAARGRLEDDGVAELGGLFQGLLGVFQRFTRAGDVGDAAGQGDLLGLELVAHAGEDPARRADELDARLLAGQGKGRVLREETVARVDSVHTALLRQGDDLVYGEVGPQGAQVLSYEIGLVRFRAEEVHRVLLGIDGERAYVQVVAGAENAYRYLAAVGGHDFFKGSAIHFVLLVSVFL